MCVWCVFAPLSCNMMVFVAGGSICAGPPGGRGRGWRKARTVDRVGLSALVAKADIIHICSAHLQRSPYTKEMCCRSDCKRLQFRRETAPLCVCVCLCVFFMNSSSFWKRRNTIIALFGSPASQLSNAPSRKLSSFSSSPAE